MERLQLAEFLGAKKFRGALSSLLDANVYAQLTNSDPWDFAIEAPYLLERGLSPNDLRFLARIQVLDHAQEIRVVGQQGRRFRQRNVISMTKRTCFVLSGKGIEAVLACLGKSAGGYGTDEILNGRPLVQALLPTKVVPIWDSDRRVLAFDGKVVKRFKWRALNQEAVLNAFQEENWPYRIFDPLAPQPEQHAKRRLSDTIKCLNRGQKNRLVYFRGDGTGQGVVWESAFEREGNGSN